MTKKTDQQWQQQLTPEQFFICRQKGTERPFSGQYCNSKDDGIYHCICCGNALFSSEEKYDSGSGWPSFWLPVSQEIIKETIDSSLGATRTEITCAQCDSHLGHVFEDGPQPSGLRYCVNSASLNLDKTNRSN